MKSVATLYNFLMNFKLSSIQSDDMVTLYEAAGRLMAMIPSLRSMHTHGAINQPFHLLVSLSKIIVFLM